MGNDRHANYFDKFPETASTSVMKPTMSLRWHHGVLEQLFIREIVGCGGQTDRVWCVVPTE